MASTGNHPPQEETRFVALVDTLVTSGVDLAFSKDGPVILEINIQLDYNDFADTSLSSHNALM